MSQIKLIDLTLLSSNQKDAVLRYMQAWRLKNQTESDHVIDPSSVKSVYVGCLWKPWTWLSYKWEITDPVLINEYN